MSSVNLFACTFITKLPDQRAIIKDRYNYRVINSLRLFRRNEIVSLEKPVIFLFTLQHEHFNMFTEH